MQHIASVHKDRDASLNDMVSVPVTGFFEISATTTTTTLLAVFENKQLRTAGETAKTKVC